MHPGAENNRVKLYMLIFPVTSTNSMEKNRIGTRLKHTESDIYYYIVRRKGFP